MRTVRRKGEPVAAALRDTDIREFFLENTEPFHDVSSTAFNLLGADAWIGGLTFVNTIDSFDGQHPRVFVPAEARAHGLQGIESANDFLLTHEDVARHFRRYGPDGHLMLLMFNSRTEEMARRLGLKIAFPPARLRHHLDDKNVAATIAERAGVDSVPHVVAKVDSYESLRSWAMGLGPDLVVQLPHGDSGTGTLLYRGAEGLPAPRS